MALVIPILRFNDENREPSYASQFNYWFSTDEFMEEILCKPHNAEFKIKNINLYDLYPDLKYKNFDSIELFDMVDNDFIVKEGTEEQKVLRQKAFEFFWNTPSRELYGY